MNFNDGPQQHLGHSFPSTFHDGLRILKTAAGRGNLELVQLLLHSRGFATSKNLICAIKSSNKELIRFLLEGSADVVDLDESEDEFRCNYGGISSPAPSPLAELFIETCDRGLRSFLFSEPQNIMEVLFHHP